MKKILKQEKGVTMFSLVVLIVMLGIITTLLLYSIKDTKDITALTNLYSDIDNLSDKVSNYYLTYGKIPTKNLEGLNSFIETQWGSGNPDSPIGANDEGDFYILDLSAIDGLTLNFGKDYEQLKNRDAMDNSLTDVYVINENSHNIFYLEGIQVEGHSYYTKLQKDTEKVVLRNVN